MQSHSQSNSPVTTAPTQQELGRAESGPDAQEETTIKSTSAGPAGPEDEKAGVQRIKTHATTSLLKLAETSNTDVELQERGPEMDSAAKLTVPAGSNRNTKPQGDGKKTDKSPRDGRKYVPSKKAMIDPLKIDMSTQLIPPLSSSQLSLQCMECHIIFSDLKSKERHLKLNHPAEYEQCILRNSLFACYVCDRHFTNSTELMAHQKTHTEKKPFKCPLCSQAFKKSSELTAHKKDHFGQDGYACADCGKPCKTLTLLKYHRRTHTGERPYICKECGKRFTMSKALQKHVLSHLPEGAEGEEGNIAAKAQQKKNDGIPGIKYSCGICKAIFKNSRTRLYHMKTKHALSAADSKTTAVRQQITPIITPISIGQPALLQVEPNGPLQKVDSNIDTEQIRKLIESLGNVQKVKQVVVLGQVPPGAPPLEVQQVSQGVKPMSLNLTPLHTQSESKTIQLNTCNNQCDPMEQTIILEPITPDGQLENPSFSEMGSQIAVGGNIELTLVQTEQTQRLEGEVMPQIIEQPDICALQSQPVDQIVCPNEGVDLEQTVILELTPALLPTLELEQTQTVSENEVPSSALVPTTDLETAPDQNIVGEQETSLSVPPLTPTVELELTPLQTEQQDLPSCPFVPPEVLTQTPSESETTPKEEVIAQQTESLNQIHQVMDESAPQETEQKAEQEPPEQESLEKLEIDQKENQEQLEKLSELEETPKEQASSQSETKQVLEISESPVNVMSAQELVKVRKRKPARAFVFQGYIQEQVRSIRKDDLQIDAKPAKRQRRKPHLVVKFGPQSKDKKNKKQKKLSPHHQSTEEEEEIAINLSEKPAASMKRGRKGKKTRKSEHLVSVAEIQSPSSTTQDQHVQQSKEDSRKTKMKRQKEESREVVAHITTHKTVASPVFKKRKQAKLLRKERPKNVKDAKKKQNLINEEKVSPKTSITPTTSITSPLIAQESLLLLKGHKQPQLKVYKLDPSKASGQTQEVSPHEPQTVSQQKKDDKLTSEAPKDLTEETKKKVGRPKKNQKALSLLSSLQISHSLPETRPVKPKTTRKRKASNVETEGVITSSHSRCALECKDCGESFTELSSLQKHKMMVHTVESPGLTYTNGNVFEGVSSLDLYQLPKQHDKVIGVMRAVADWDTEPEMGEMVTEDRERAVSFPALIPSPSLPVPPEVEMSTYEDKVRSENEDADQSHASPEVHSPSKRQKRTETPSTLTSDSGSSASTQTKSVETREDLATDEAKEENDTLKLCSSESEVQAGVDEDLKEDLLLEVDLVTVGEQNERDDAAFPQENVPENESESKTTCTSEGGSTETLVPEETDKTTSQTSQAVSCSTHQMEIKEEEEEILVQRKKGGKGVVTRSGLRGRRRVVGRLKRSMISRMSFSGETVRGTGSEKEQDECQIIYDSEIHNNSSTRTSPTETSPDPESNTATATASGLLAAPSTLEESPDEEVVLELESVTTSVEEVMNERGLQGGEEPDREVDQSPGIILEKILTSRQRETADGELNPMTARSNQTLGFSSIAENELQAPGIQEIKVEETITDPSLTATVCQNRLSASRDIRTVLVKEESSLTLNEVQASQSSGHLRWSVEPVDNQNTASPLMESVEMSSECHVTPELSPAQCIFYPVKEEEREVLLGSSQTSRSSSTLEGSDAAHQTERQTADSTLHEVHRATQVYQETGVSGRLSEPGISDFTDGRAEAEVEWPHPLDLRDFLLRGSDDEEDVAGFELSDPQVESEAEVMAYFNKNQPDSTRQPEQTSQNLPASTNQRQAPSNENRTVAPVDYFYKYFGWDTWIEIANCTNKASSLRDNTTASEVSRFVGIHVAMGTLKFPSPKLYWEDLTKVPLISEAMSLSRFLELSRTLKLTSPEKDPVNCNDQAAGRDVDFQNGCQGKTPTRQRLMSLHSKRQCQREEQSESNGSDTQTDPLWKVQPLLCHFNAACRSLRRDGDYAVDQYLVPLTAKLHNSKLSLHCTTLLGFGGLLLHVDFKLDLSEKEDAVEKMVPKGSMVFLCKQELSTPAMLERLLIAGVHGAGRVGGARGQIGDEFVSSDGKLMLRRSHFGFILSTAGCGQRNMASLSDNFEKAQMSARLNRDLRNLYSTPLAASAPACWPQAVLWYLTDLALVNSWLQYRQDHRAASAPLTLMAFRLEVSKALIFSSGSDTQDSVPPQPPTENAHITSETLNPGLVEESPLPDVETRYDGTGHWPEQLGEGEGGRCRFGDCQRTSRVLCLKCCVFLCISRNHNCFLNFHNQGISGKE